MKVLSIVGARPQFVKAAVVSRALSMIDGIGEVLLHTGQHYDKAMSQVFFSQLGIQEPDYNLAIGSGNHGSQTGRMLSAIEDVLLLERPDLILVYGDTNSTLAGALAASKLHIRVAHVEAGLRSFNRKMPEEINRVLTDHLSDLLFAPTDAAATNLEAEGIHGEKVLLTGDVMYDAALHFASTPSDGTKILEHHSLADKEYVLATVHRAENTDDPLRLRAIFDGLVEVAEKLPVVLPLHPRTRKMLSTVDTDTSDLLIIDPVGYLDMVVLERNARLIATDSGGVQKEAYFYRVPCVTLRDETEWVELVEHGWNLILPPTDGHQVAAAILRRLNQYGEDVDLYGGGRATERIAGAVENFRP